MGEEMYDNIDDHRDIYDVYDISTPRISGADAEEEISNIESAVEAIAEDVQKFIENHRKVETLRYKIDSLMLFEKCCDAVRVVYQERITELEQCLDNEGYDAY